MALTARAALRGGSAAASPAGRPGSGTSGSRRAGFTLIELIIVAALLSLLVGISLPVVKFTVKRVKEMELREALRTMRNAVDEYKRFSDAGLLPIDLGTDGYPKELEVLVEGVDVVGQVDRKVKFLRRIPVDPMTGESEWGLRSYQDAFDSDSWGGENVFDVYSLSEGIGLDGVPYSQW
jgi:general secretion pathway protein G